MCLIGGRPNAIPFALFVNKMGCTLSGQNISPTHLEHCDGVVRVGSLCLNHPELLQKHPTHLASSVMVWFVEVRCA